MALQVTDVIGAFSRFKSPECRRGGRFTFATDTCKGRHIHEEAKLSKDVFMGTNRQLPKSTDKESKIVRLEVARIIIPPRGSNQVLTESLEIKPPYSPPGLAVKKIRRRIKPFQKTFSTYNPNIWKHNTKISLIEPIQQASCFILNVDKEKCRSHPFPRRLKLNIRNGVLYFCLCAPRNIPQTAFCQRGNY
ncbi:hypothetical protein TcasGA2_TC008375 [Tribolium castaneum]|uniref:Uncharacterized protein n=1 Tax=Tribolium castaneum TaxID=7070 RepID=D2A1D5_TRICA|nr:hypothetical protein TcasGA2_TC008375 [Tribolium castaneum]